MKYNDLKNAERFISDQISWAKANGYGDFTIWCNGKELVAIIDSNDIATVIMRGRLKTEGYWKLIVFENGEIK